MKRMLGLLAVLVMVIGCGETTPVATTDEPATPAVAEAPASGETLELQTIALKVPSMHCPFGCWPTVQSTLAKQPHVADVKLAAQKDPNAIDNPVVLVSFSGDFDQAKAFSELAEAGFADAAVQTEEKPAAATE